MRGAFQVPKEPMGEAWFMGSERKMYDLARSVAYDNLPFEYVSDMLTDISSGVCCFGEFREWREWFHYLFPRVLGHPFEMSAFNYRLELAMTACFAQYPDGLTGATYNQFPQDALATAGQAIMNAELWDGDHLRVGTGLIREGRSYGEE
jgi:hypothetical protein